MKSMIAALVLGLTLAWVPPATAAGEEPVKFAFGGKNTPARIQVAIHGSYAKGCLAGAVQLPLDGPYFSRMRLSRDRGWGHPDLIAFLQRWSARAPKFGLGGVLIGDMSQARGGPMKTGHRSHQTGLDVDIWLRPLQPDARPGLEARESLSSYDVVKGRHSLDETLWSTTNWRMIRAAAEDKSVARIFVNPAIKRKLCQTVPKAERGWMQKVRAWWGHDAHFHIRLHCPEGGSCENQAPPPEGDGCNEELDWWFTEEPYEPSDKPRKELLLADLPTPCVEVLNAP